jgi:hypothetical protein
VRGRWVCTRSSVSATERSKRLLQVQGSPRSLPHFPISSSASSLLSPLTLNDARPSTVLATHHPRLPPLFPFPHSSSTNFPSSSSTDNRLDSASSLRSWWRQGRRLDAQPSRLCEQGQGDQAKEFAVHVCCVLSSRALLFDVDRLFRSSGCVIYTAPHGFLSLWCAIEIFRASAHPFLLLFRHAFLFIAQARRRTLPATTATTTNHDDENCRRSSSRVAQGEVGRAERAKEGAREKTRKILR